MTYLRKPTINTNPLHAGEGQDHYTQYFPADAAQAARVISDVRAVLNDTVIARCLKVITRNGESKNFETITGEDGLTFGIKDFTSGSVRSLVQKLSDQSPALLTDAFGSHRADAENAAWLEANISDRADEGLVAIRWFREGLDKLLCNRNLHALQLDLFRQETIEPCVTICREEGWQLEFSLGALAGIANSYGGGGVRKQLAKVREIVGTAANERTVIRELVKAYALRDAKSKMEATKRLLRRGFGDEAGSLPGADDLNHSGRRILALFQVFSWTSATGFGEDLGAFTLSPDEGLADP